MEQKIRYLTPRQYAEMKQIPLRVVMQMMQPSRNTANIFDSRDIYRTSPKHPRLVYRARDAAGIEWPRTKPRSRGAKNPVASDLAADTEGQREAVNSATF
jgi:hypothetical protein